MFLDEILLSRFVCISGDSACEIAVEMSFRTAGVAQHVNTFVSLHPHL
jgi:hypothetical protein